MSLHLYLLMIEGDQLARLREVFTAFNYEILRTDNVAGADWESVEEAMEDNCPEPGKVKKAAWYNRGWTIIWDPELVLASGVDEEVHAKLSRELGGRILGVVCEGTSGSYSFVQFAEGRLSRRLAYSFDGEGLEQSGEALEVEPDDLEKIDEDDTVEMMRRITGIGLADLREAASYTIYLLGEPRQRDSEESHWADSSKAEYEQQVRDLERIARDSPYASWLKDRARAKLREMSEDQSFPEWLRSQAREAFERLGPAAPERTAGLWRRVLRGRS